MAKLVLYLPDGSLHDILLDKERLTIGRRADNDVCLPYPAVSGEHAAVTTILADSFLEDLGSTNGTLVNGKAIVKHFLRDNDHIDIGRHRLVYFVHDAAQADPMTPDLLRREVLGLHEQVQRVREAREEKRKAVPPPPAVADQLLADDDLLADFDAAASDVFAQSASRAGAADETTPSAPHGEEEVARRLREGGVPASSTDPSRKPDRSSSMVATRLASTWSPDAPAAEAGAHVQTSPDPTAPVVSSEPARPAAAAPPVEPSPASYRVRVLSGPSTGRELPLARDPVSVGRVGTQVARLVADASGWRLASLEGAEPLEINGKAVPAEGAALSPGDRFRVAGADLVFEHR